MPEKGVYVVGTVGMAEYTTNPGSGPEDNRNKFGIRMRVFLLGRMSFCEPGYDI